jgi:hypothetical protein
VINDDRALLRLFFAAVAMVITSSTRRAGGEYGDVRASIDNVKLNAYLANSIPAVAVPVTIKQFKVRPFATVKHYSKPCCHSLVR